MDPEVMKMMASQFPDLQKTLQNNPDAVKQMDGFWKFLNNLAESSPQEYQTFIDQQMQEMKSEMNKEKKEEESKQTIKSTAAFCMKALVAKKVEKSQERPKNQGLKLFDFNDSQIQESYLDSDEKTDPLEEPKIYLNIVYHDSILPPLNKQRDIANTKIDKEWVLIPIVFTKPQTRKSLDGLQCIHYDAHINTCVYQKMREGDKQFRSVMSFILMKFQDLLKDEYIIHKRSIKFLKKKAYKDAKGTNSQTVADFVLPKEHNIESFKKAKEYLQKQKQEEEKKKIKEVKVEKPVENFEDKIKIPGANLNKTQDQQGKKPLIQEIIVKQTPKFEISDQLDTLIVTFFVELEESAKSIELDIAEQQLKLSSPHYQFDHKISSFKVDPNSVRAKFSKVKKTLTLTINKKK